MKTPETHNFRTGDDLILSGLTQKGRNRVREHGRSWRVVLINMQGVLLLSNSDGYQKWLSEDFQIEEVVPQTVTGD